MYICMYMHSSSMQLRASAWPVSIDTIFLKKLDQLKYLHKAQYMHAKVCAPVAGLMRMPAPQSVRASCANFTLVVGLGSGSTPPFSMGHALPVAAQSNDQTTTSNANTPRNTSKKHAAHGSRAIRCSDFDACPSRHFIWCSSKSARPNKLTRRAPRGRGFDGSSCASHWVH